MGPTPPQTSRRSARRPLPADLEQRVTPVTRAGLRLLPVPELLEPLFPGGGLQRGWSVGVSGVGGWSLALALLGPVLRGDGWAAGVGVEELGLVAGDELGVPLQRLLLVETPGEARQAEVVAALVEVVDVVCLGPVGSFSTRDARRLAARAREQEAVLVHLDGGRSWPQGLDVILDVTPGPWIGLESGHGHLRARPVTITATGRRAMAQRRRVEVLLPGPGGALASPSVLVPDGREVGVPSPSPLPPSSPSPAGLGVDDEVPTSALVRAVG
ncbi:MAG: hypothetical protein AAGA93_17670 [Actinomycetota bacterium]